MPTPEIIQKVKDLHQQIADTPNAPADATQIQKQLDTILVQPEHAPHYASLSDRLRDAYVKFQTDHPRLARAMVDLDRALDAAGL